MLKISYSKEYYRAATFEIPYKSSPVFNKNVSCSSNTLTGRGPANYFFQKMLQDFVEHPTCQKKVL